MQFEGISPALLAAAPGQLSSKDFQRSLYTWFEETGLVADLRSYLRVQMINKLRGSDVGKLDQKPASSLSKQAFNLVVAEHLLREGCHYTLSVFSTEVPPMTGQLPFSLFEATRFKENEKWKFDEDSVGNLLELIGIPKASEQCVTISVNYFRDDNSLLRCIVSSKFSGGVQSVNVEVKASDFNSYLRRILEILQAPQKLVGDLEEKMQQFLLEEKNKTYEIFDRNSEELKKEITLRDSEIKRLHNEQVVTKKENKRLKIECKAVKKRGEELGIKEDAIRVKEELLGEKIKELATIEEQMKTIKECSQIHCTESCITNAKQLEELRHESAHLQAINQNQSLEIEKLRSKMTLLANDLRSSQAKIVFLNTCLVQFNKIPSNEGELAETSEDSSENLTDEILQQVRVRLGQLERESDDLDSKFKRLRMK